MTTGTGKKAARSVRGNTSTFARAGSPAEHSPKPDLQLPSGANRSEERARLLLEYAPDAFYLIDLEGRFVDGNKAGEELIGYRREEVIGKSFRELDLLEESSSVQAADGLVQGAKDQATGPKELTLRRKDRSLVTVEVRTYPVKIDGQMLVLGIARDITERKQAEEELRASEARLRLVWEHSIDGMRLTDHRGCIVAVNEAYCRLVGLPRERLIGQLFSVAYPENGPEGRRDDYLERFSRGQLEPRRTARIRLWNGKVLELDIAASFIEAGRRKLVLTIFRDLTARQQAERAGAAFSNLGLRLSAARTAREAAEIIVDVADQLLGWDACICDLYSPADDLVAHVLSIDVVEGRRTECVMLQGRHSPTPIARRALLTGGHLIRGESRARIPGDSLPFGDEARMSASILYVPIRNGTEVTGLLSIQSYRPGAYDENSLKTLQALADHCGSALDRIRAQEELQATQQRLQHLLAESPAVIYALRLEGDGFVPAWFSHYLQPLLGFSPEEACKPEWLNERIHPDDVVTVRDWMTRLLTQKRITREYRLRHKNGKYRWVLDEQRLVCDENGEPREVAGSWIDITERKALEEAQLRLATAVEQAAESIVITDVQGSILYVNPAFEHVTGYTRQEALGQTPRLLKSGKHDLTFYRQLWGQLTSGNSWHGRFVNKRKDGKIIEAEATITPIRDTAGKINYYVAVQHDVTRQVQLETQLRQSQKMEAVGQLAGGVAHDFNNLLLVMRGNAELLQLNGVAQAEPAREYLRQITSAAERAANLTRQLLAFSRKQVMQSQPLLLDEVIADLARMLKRIIGEHIDLKCHHSIGLPHVDADAGMMEQVLVNLVVNARDAMPQGGQLHISTERVLVGEADTMNNPEARTGEFVCVAVRDSGTGIAPEILPHLFEPFFTTKEPGKGTGLGLATVYGIVKQHQGWLDVTSSPGEGATFKIFLPALAAPAAKTVPAPAEPPPVRGGPETILLVEDDTAVRMVTRRVLESFGYKIHEAATAREALRVWDTHHQEIALLLTDVVMPDGMNGRELSERLREQRANLKIILVSGYSSDVAGKETNYFRRTNTRFIQKPCSARTLLESVRECLDK